MPTSNLAVTLESATMKLLLPVVELPGPWTRIEPVTRDKALKAGLRCTIADPLWMLGRQHQVGELSGEDAASPVRVSGAVGTTRVTQLAPGVSGAAAAVGDRSPPPEVVLEREDPLLGLGATRAAADAGLLLMRALVEAGLEDIWTILRQRPEYALKVPSDAPVELRLLARRSLDGLTLLRGNALTIPTIWGHAKRDQIASTLRACKTVVDARWTAPSASQESWTSERQEYAFSLLSTPLRGTDPPPVKLTADDHPGGRLDWYSADMSAQTPQTLATTAFSGVPLPVRFRGSPTSRWWEIETTVVNWAGIDGGPEDPARLMAAEFMTVYSDDWFLVPVRLQRGTLARIDSVQVADTFTWRKPDATGTPTLLPTTLSALAAVDGPKRVFRFFELSGDTGPDADKAAARTAPWLYVPDGTGTLQQGDPIEEVRFIRDEAANLGWAVEKVVEGYDGGPRQRAAPRPPAEEARTDGRWVYTIQTPVPTGWLPLVPVQIGTTSQIRLRRGKLPEWTDSDGPQGRIASGKPFYLREEELPPGGLVVTRRWQRTRGPDGKVWLWIGREKRPGSAEVGPGLAFDHIHR